MPVRGVESTVTQCLRIRVLLPFESMRVNHYGIGIIIGAAGGPKTMMTDERYWSPQ